MQRAMGSYCTYSSLVKLQSWFLSLRARPAFGRTAALVPALAVKDLPLGRTLVMMMMMIYRYILLRIDYDRHISFHFGHAVLSTHIFITILINIDLIVRVNLDL